MSDTPFPNGYYGFDSNASGGYWPIRGSVGHASSGLAVTTSASPIDLGTITIGFNRYIVTNVYFESLNAGGSLGLATVDIRTAPSGGGTSILSGPALLLSITAANLVQSLTTAALGAVQTGSMLWVRQTINSANTGTIAAVVVTTPVP